MRLSIISINLNNGTGLQKTIQSVLEQSFHDYEFIIIDGGSADNSKQVIKANQENFSYWISEPDKGIFNAMNKGIQAAKGEYCLFLNSGDRLFDRDTLQNAFDSGFYEDIIYGIQFIEKNNTLIEDPCLDVPYLTFSTLKKSHIPHQCTFIKRDLFTSVGLYNEENLVVSDWEFVMLALFKFNRTIKRIYLPIAIYDQKGISSDEDKTLQYDERNIALHRHFPLFMPDYEYYEAFMQKKYIRNILKFRDLLKKIGFFP